MAVTLSPAVVGSLAFNSADVQKYFISPLYLGNDVLARFDVMSNIKGSTYLDHFASTTKITLADNGGSFDGQTAGNYSNPIISPQRVEAEHAINGNTFFNKVKGMALKMGTHKDNIDGTVIKEVAAKYLMAGIQADFNRQLWFGNTTESISIGADYSVYKGIWQSLQAVVPAGQQTVDAFAGYAASSTNAIDALESVYGSATPELLEAPKAFYVSGAIADAYVRELTDKGVAPAYMDLQNGIANLSYRGIPIVVRRDWDSVLLNDFAHITDSTANLGNAAADDTYTSAAGARIALIADNALVVGTDFDSASLDSWYNMDEKQMRFRFGYLCGTVLLDAKLACTYMNVQE